jgi:hypothetical protein
MIQIVVTIKGAAGADNPVGMGVGAKFGVKGSEQEATDVERQVAAQIMAAVKGIQHMPEMLAQLEQATGAGSSIIVPGNAGKLAVPH